MDACKKLSSNGTGVEDLNSSLMLTAGVDFMWSRHEFQLIRDWSDLVDAFIWRAIKYNSASLHKVKKAAKK